MVSTKTRPDCSHMYTTRIDKECGAFICILCGYHKDMVACYCGWSITGLDGRKYLEDKGEDIN